MLGYRFSFRTYAKNIRKKTTKWSLVLLDADWHVLTLVWYLSRWLQIVLRATKSLDILIFVFLNLFDVGKKLYSGLRETDYNTWTSKFDPISEFQNIISDIPPPARVIITHCVLKWICHLPLNWHHELSHKREAR